MISDLEKFFYRLRESIIAQQRLNIDNIEDSLLMKTILNPEKDRANYIGKDWHNVLNNIGQTYERPPSFIAKRYLVENDKVGGIYNIDIWDRFNAFVIIYPKSITNSSE